MSIVLNNRYELAELLGSGGMADVYLAHDLRLNRDVAIKLLRSDLARDPAFLARFRKEALAAAGLNHPGIVSVFDSGEDSGNSYIVMELVHGKTLREILKSGEALSLRRVLEIISGILQALEYSHSRGIIHRDIKPGNIMITDDYEVKVMDFGIARALADVGATMTNTWNIVGTAQYLSPEQASGEVADFRSDIYSVGCVLYELLTGQPPFLGETPVSIAFQHVSGEVIPASQYFPALDPGIDRIVNISLAKNPEHRYQSASAMQQDVALALQGQRVRTKLAGRNFSRMPVIATVVVLAISALFGGIYFFSTNGKVAMAALPNVVGLTESQGRALLPGFTITIAHAPSSLVPRDRIAIELPPATAKVPAGSSVTLTISDGAGNTVVPTNLVGLSLTDARIALAGAGLVISQTVPVDSALTPGTVVSATPLAGATVEAGSGVVLQIASGNIQVPDLTNMSEISARTVLVQAGFLVKEIFATQAGVAGGQVLAQAPAAGTSQSIGSTVTITVSQGDSATPSANN